MTDSKDTDGISYVRKTGELKHAWVALNKYLTIGWKVQSSCLFVQHPPPPRWFGIIQKFVEEIQKLVIMGK